MKTCNNCWFCMSVMGELKCDISRNNVYESMSCLHFEPDPTLMRVRVYKTLISVFNVLMWFVCISLALLGKFETIGLVFALVITSACFIYLVDFIVMQIRGLL